MLLNLPYWLHDKSYLIIIAVLLLVAAAAVAFKKLTPIAGATGFFIGLFIFIGCGYPGVIMLATFFFLGTTATSWGKDRKKQMSLIENERGERTAGQVIANGGVAALLGVTAVWMPASHMIITIMAAASLSSATADTLSSELGVLYGRRFYNIITLKKDERGLDGVISLEGTVIGILGSTLIAFVYAITTAFNHWFVWIVVAGTVGNLSDSILGATLERKHQLNNNAVNFFNTSIAAAVIYIVFVIDGIGRN